MHSPAPYMQYFVGDFDGTSFKNESTATKIYRPDYGPDYYAAILYNNLPAGYKPISMGWVNNWNYANDIPTTPWKSAMSLPRELMVKKINNEWILIQQPLEKIKELRQEKREWINKEVAGSALLPIKSQVLEMEIEFTVDSKSIAGVRLVKGSDGFIEVGYDAVNGLLYIDRSKAGDTSFHASFSKLSRYEAYIKPVNGKILLHIFLDKSLLEVFANNGQVCMSAQLFPAEKSNGVELFANSGKEVFNVVRCWKMKSTW